MEVQREISLKRFLIALNSEVYATLRMRSAWLLVIIPSLAIIIRMIILKISALTDSTRSRILGQTPNAGDNGFGNLVDAMSSGITLIYLIFVGYAAFSFAIDRDHGVVRHLVIRQVSRTTLVLSKFLILHGLAFLSIIMALLTAYFLANYFWDLVPVVEDGYELISLAEIKGEISLGLTLALIPIPACLAFGLFLSILSHSATQAVTLALGTTLALDVFKTVLGEKAQYIYSTFQPSLVDMSYLNDVAKIVRGFSDLIVNQGFLSMNYMVPPVYAALFLLLSLFAIQRSNL